MAPSLEGSECVAMGLPVVAVHTLIMASLCRDDEVAGFDAGDLATFAELLVQLRRARGSGQAMLARARRFSREHAWAREFGRHCDLLQRLIGRRLTGVRPGDPAHGLSAGRRRCRALFRLVPPWPSPSMLAP